MHRLSTSIGHIRRHEKEGGGGAARDSIPYLAFVYTDIFVLIERDS